MTNMDTSKTRKMSDAAIEVLLEKVKKAWETHKESIDDPYTTFLKDDVAVRKISSKIEELQDI